MGFSQKSVYALRAMFELARRRTDKPTSVSAVAESQNIPFRFLENILIELKRAGLVKSMRGKEGGYILAAAPSELSVGQVLRAVEGPLTPISCLRGEMQKNCPLRENCAFLPMWARAHQVATAVYDSTSFHDLLAQGQAVFTPCNLTYTI